MNSHIGKLLGAGVVLTAIAAISFMRDPRQEIVRDAYIHGYPLVTMDLTRKQETNVRVPD